jgi:hypothetical protein
LNADGDGFAVFGKKEGSRGFAGFFDGHVWVSGNLSVGTDVILTGADCAEDFDLAEAAEPGTVMVLSDEGTVRPSAEAYDKRVVGVVSGAGTYRPGIILDKKRGRGGRSPIALVGKSFVKWMPATHRSKSAIS